MSKQLNLAHFFSSNKRTRSSSPALTQEHTQSSPPPPITTFTETSAAATSEANNSSVTKKSKQIDHENSINRETQVFSKNDIGLFVNKENISDSEKHAALTDPWTPSSTCKFPLVQMHQKMRSVCQHSWLHTYPWLS